MEILLKESRRGDDWACQQTGSGSSLWLDSTLISHSRSVAILPQFYWDIIDKQKLYIFKFIKWWVDVCIDNEITIMVNLISIFLSWHSSQGEVSSNSCPCVIAVTDRYWKRESPFSFKGVAVERATVLQRSATNPRVYGRGQHKLDLIGMWV